MKKTLLALAVLGAFAGAASAQTAVTIYGSFDGGLREVSHVGAAAPAGNPKDSKWTVGSNGTYNSNRLGFKGVEDLGGGLNAHFVLESGFNTGTGALDTATTTNKLFNRSAYVGLGGTFGSFDLGRQYSVNFKTIGAYDPFAYKYTAIIPLAAQGGLTRLDNDLQYTGTFGPVTARAEYAFGEQAGSTSDAATAAVGASFASGPFSAGAAYTKRKNNVAVAPAAASFQDQKDWTIGGAFKTAAFSVAVGYADNKQDTGTAAAQTRTKDGWVGGSFNVTPAAALSLAYYRTKLSSQAAAPAAAGTTTEGRKDLAIFGATYALSKRTNFYADIDNAKFSGAVSAANGQHSQTGISAGINHLF